MYLTAWSKVFAFGQDAFVVIDVILPAVLGSMEAMSPVHRCRNRLDTH